MLIDYHLHSQFSCDSRTNMEQICQAALNAGLTEIAFTDHMDLTYPHQYENHYIHDLDHYFATIAQYQQRYSGQLRIRVGLEIGLERHRLSTRNQRRSCQPKSILSGQKQTAGVSAVLFSHTGLHSTI